MRNSQAEVTIIGAGVSGLAAAWQLARAGVSSVVFEKSRGLSGRAATRRKHGHLYDHGANFFRLDDPQVAHLLQHELTADGLVEIPGDVHTFDGGGHITPGDRAHNAVPKWTYRDGISTLGKQLLAAAAPHAEVVRQTRIARIGKTDDRWWVEDDAGRRHGTWQHLVLAIPPPQAADLLRASGLDAALATALDAIRYHPQFSLILGYARPPLPERKFHALVNTDGRHPLAWLGFEEDKPGHVANGASVIVAQMAPAWTTDHYDTPPADWLDEALAIVGNLLAGNPLPAPDWWDSQRWRHAHPVSGGALPDPALETHASSASLHFTGDGMAGKGRVPLAIKAGLDTAGRMLARLKTNP